MSRSFDLGFQRSGQGLLTGPWDTGRRRGLTNAFLLNPQYLAPRLRAKGLASLYRASRFDHLRWIGEEEYDALDVRDGGEVRGV